MRGAAAEKVCEDKTHHEQRQQRRQHAPRHAEHGALVFLFEVTPDRLLEKELIGFKFLERGLAVSFYCFIYAFAIVPIVKSKKLVDALPIQWFQFAAVFHVFDDFGNGLIEGIQDFPESIVFEVCMFLMIDMALIECINIKLAIKNRLSEIEKINDTGRVVCNDQAA